MSSTKPDSPPLDTRSETSAAPASADGSPGRAVQAAMYGLTLVALALSIFLAVYALREGQPIPGCNEGGTFDCGHVLKSKWSRVFGVPVGVAAGGAYLLTLVVLPFIGAGSPPNAKRLAWTILLIAAMGIVAAAAWFLTLQTAVIGSFCIYCVITHATGVALALLIFGSAPLRTPAGNADAAPLVSRQRLLLCVWVGLMTPILLYAGVAPQPIMLLRGSPMPIQLVPEDFPRLGDVTRGTVLLSLSDYSCPHCRGMHEYLLRAKERYGNAVSIVILPMPLDGKCNARVKRTEKRHENACELARHALTVWRAKPEAFPEYDAWLFKPEMPRLPVDAQSKAIELVGKEAFERAQADPWVQSKLEMSIRLYDALGGGSLPKLLTPINLRIEGEPASEEELMGVLEHEVGIRPPPGVKPAPKPKPVELPAPVKTKPDELFRVPAHSPAGAPATAPASAPNETHATEKPESE